MEELIATIQTEIELNAEIDSVNVSYVSHYLTEDFLGSAGTGSSGDANRVFTLAYANAVEITSVFLNGILLTNTVQYTKDDSTKSVTILWPVYDDQNITIFYYPA